MEFTLILKDIKLNDQKDNNLIDKIISYLIVFLTIIYIQGSCNVLMLGVFKFEKFASLWPIIWGRVITHNKNHTV